MRAPDRPAQHWPVGGFATVLTGLRGVLIGNQEPTPSGCCHDQRPLQGAGGHRASFLLPAFSFYQCLSQADPQQKQLAEGGSWKCTLASASTAAPQACNTGDSAEGPLALPHIPAAIWSLALCLGCQETTLQSASHLQWRM
ncbi:uncharacterized protein LOC110743625 [Papio anubis]|uniref:uncharacterized protein LOC110743625 n=1 Tax=Papio anubis TaxID=9555 RepID=UPI000B7AF828|nr:uncharacterized protein LOC110743625 [Papio anubis]